MSKIKSLRAREIFDSRGNPTVEVEIQTENGNWARACVPSGASTGQKEALELRDGDRSRLLGKGVLKACENVNSILAKELIGHEVTDQAGIDSKMLELDGTENKSKYGANALLAVSLTAARAGCYDEGMSLYSYLGDFLKAPKYREGYTLPAPLMNIINGGEHASNNLDIQEFMIVPHLSDRGFRDNFRAGVEIFHNLKKVLSEKKYSTNVGDEGGFAPNLKSHEEALDLILQSIEMAGYRPGDEISLSLDCAASEFYKNGMYHVQGAELNSSEMIDYLDSIALKYPIYSIEDGLDENDHDGWKEMTSKMGDRVKLVGDDLFVTNKKIFQDGINNKEANAILIKVNQIGTLTETFEAMKLGFDNDYMSVVSHRSGETGDDFIADLAVATAAGHIKTGSASRSDRIEKYNQLLRIDEQLGFNKSNYHLIK